MEDKYTFVAEERNAKSLIDYIVLTQTLGETVQDIETRKEAEIGTNHKLVTAKLRATVNKSEEIKYSKIALHNLKEPGRQKEYQDKTNKRFRKLINEKMGDLETK